MEYVLYAVVAIAGIVIAMEANASRMRKALAEQLAAAQEAKEQAKADYEAALEALRDHPADPKIREDALAKGRKYSNLTRNAQGVTLYDEMAIKNDLDAAAAASAISVLTEPAGVSSTTCEQRLRNLSDLKVKGLIREAEYEEKRRAIIEEL